jgi:hypothetical protein
VKHKAFLAAFQRIHVMLLLITHNNGVPDSADQSAIKI